MKKINIQPDIDLQNSREYYGVSNSRDFYKGKSFNFAQGWAPGINYYNDSYIQDFVASWTVEWIPKELPTMLAINKINRIVIWRFIYSLQFIKNFWKASLIKILTSLIVNNVLLFMFSQFGT